MRRVSCRCLGEACNGVAVWQADPYALDVHGELEESFICDHEYDNLVWEI